MQSMGGTQHENVDHVIYERLCRVAKIAGQGDLMTGLKLLEKNAAEYEECSYIEPLYEKASEEATEEEAKEVSEQSNES